MAAPVLDQYFVEDAERLTGEIPLVARAKGRVSPLMPKGVLPTGIGHNFQTAIVERSIATGGGGWVEVDVADGSGNNCVLNPGVVAPAINTFSYKGYANELLSTYICFTDAQAGYMFEDVVGKQRKNFLGNVVDTWEDRDTAMYINACGRKIILDASFSESGYDQAIPASEATGTLMQDFLDDLYMEILQDGGGDDGAYGNKNGQPLIPLIIDPRDARRLIKNDPSVREDFRFAEMGQGADATLLKSWGADKAYGGFLHVNNIRMPRYDFVGGAYVQRPFYSTSAATIGDQADPSTLYRNAEYGLALVWSKDVLERLVPPSLGSVGADTTGKTTPFDGTVTWLNIPDMEINRYQDQGRWAARMYAAYKPMNPRRGIALIYKRCPGVTLTDCY